MRRHLLIGHIFVVVGLMFCGSTAESGCFITKSVTACTRKSSLFQCVVCLHGGQCCDKEWTPALTTNEGDTAPVGGTGRDNFTDPITPSGCKYKKVFSCVDPDNCTWDTNPSFMGCYNFTPSGASCTGT